MLWGTWRGFPRPRTPHWTRSGQGAVGGWLVERNGVKVRLVAVLATVFLLGGLSISASTADAASRHYSKSVQASRDYALRAIGPTQFRCLDALFERESHWNPLAHNRTSGAHGIPQALPGVKMKKFGKDWATNPLVQVKWGLYYIKHRYGNACNALQHAYTTGWY